MLEIEHSKKHFFQSKFEKLNSFPKRLLSIFSIILSLQSEQFIRIISTLFSFANLSFTLSISYCFFKSIDTIRFCSRCPAEREKAKEYFYWVAN